jgi:hypothetical protein
VLLGASPEKYGTWLENACYSTLTELPPGQRVVFINAWNEWAEGCHLEPDARHGRAYLERTRAALKNVAEKPAGTLK